VISISNNEIQEFVLLLRERGIQVGLSEHLDAQVCYSTLFPKTTQDDSSLFLALRSVLVKRRDDYEIFARAYEDFFLLNAQSGRVISPVPNFARKSRPASEVNKLEASSRTKEDDQGESAEDQKRAILSLYSNNRSLLRKLDFENVEPFQPDDIKYLARKLRKISRLNQALPGRRKSQYTDYRGGYVNWRRLARLMSSHPDAIPKIQFMRRKLARSKFVVMADVSGSMLKDTELVINSLFTASRRFHGTEAFVFSTGLSRLTHFFSIASPNSETAQRFYSKQTEIELGSGTRIGENLAKVIRDFPDVISRDTTLIIISDGWDLGDSNLLETCLHDVKLRGAKVVWFHPHFGHPDFAPVTVAMKTAMPYIDLMVGPNRAIQSTNR
jgi:hypothetical protein